MFSQHHCLDGEVEVAKRAMFQEVFEAASGCRQPRKLPKQLGECSETSFARLDKRLYNMMFMLDTQKSFDESLGSWASLSRLETSRQHVLSFALPPSG